MAAPPTTVSSASHQLKPLIQAATAIPSSTGTNVAVRNGSRVARRKSQPKDSRGRTSRPVSNESRSRYFRACGTPRSESSKNDISCSSQPSARSGDSSRPPSTFRSGPQSET